MFFSQKGEIVKPNSSAATTVVQQNPSTVHSAPTPSPTTDNTIKENESTCRLISDIVMEDPRVYIEDTPRIEAPFPVTFVDPSGGGLLSLTSQHLAQACPLLKKIGLT